MSEHKRNPTAIKAKAGEIPPKPPRPTKRERERELHGLIAAWFASGCPRLKSKEANE